VKNLLSLLKHTSKKSENELDKDKEIQQLKKQVKELKKLNSFNERLLSSMETVLNKSESIYKSILDALPFLTILTTKQRQVIAVNKMASDKGGKVGSYCFQSFGRIDSMSEKSSQYVKTNEARHTHCSFCMADDSLNNNQIMSKEVLLNNEWYDVYWCPISENTLMHYMIPITDRKNIEIQNVQLEEIEEKLLDKELQLFQSQKLEAIGTFAEGIAHDFNNILFIIYGNVEILLETIKTVKDRKRLSTVFNATKKGIDLVKQLLLFGRKTNKKPVNISINNQVKTTMEMLSHIIPKMVDFEVDLNENISLVNADSLQIDQVITNLCINASAAMPDGGKITLKTDNLIIDERNQHSNIPYGKYVMLTVSDSGIGIDAESKKKIFDPFFTTKNIGEGSGLGLTVVLGIIKNHNGFIFCSSEIKKGTVFTIYLPASPYLNKNTLIPKDTNPIHILKKTVLVIDDEPGVSKIMVNMLKSSGHDVFLANSGESAIDVYTKNIKQIDLVLLDSMMPGMGGKKCLEELIKINPDVKVIIVSGYYEKRFLNELLKIGAKKYLKKPFLKQDLREVIAAIFTEDAYEV